MKVNLLSGKGDINMEIKAKKLITDLKTNNQTTETKKKIYIRREDFIDFCRCMCPHARKKKDGSIFCLNKETCKVGILEDHDNEVRQELYDDIRKKLLG